MRTRSSGHFLAGLVGGLFLGLLGLSLAAALLGIDPDNAVQRVSRELAPAVTLVEVNLRGSAWLFAAVLVFYLLQYERLQSVLRQSEPAVEQVARHEQLLDLCANLSFGIGVIWTAIGMREALLFALGDPGGAADLGAFAVLQRLVDGGILLALSTTIVGGVGGYLMRVAKSLFLGQQLAAVYLHAADSPMQQNLDTLRRIEQNLAARELPANAGEPAP